MRSFYLIAFLFISTGVFSQHPAIDSLQKVLKNTKDDTTRLNLYINLCFVCPTKDNLKYAEPALEIANKLLSQTKDENEKNRVLRRKVDALDCIAIYYEEMGDALKGSDYTRKSLSLWNEIEGNEGVLMAINRYTGWCRSMGNVSAEYEYLQQAILIFQNSNFQKGKTKCLSQLAYLYSEYGDSSQALVNYQKVLSNYEELKDTVAIARVLTGYSYLMLHPEENRLQYFNKGISLYEQLNDTDGIRQAYLNIGALYDEKNNDLPNAIKYYKKSLLKAEEMKNQFWIAVILDNLSEIYIRQGFLDSALVYTKAALRINEALDDYVRISRSLENLARIYFINKKYKEAKDYAVRSITFRERSGRVQNPLTILLEVQIDSALNNYKEAFEHYKKYIILQDKLKNEEFSKTATREKYQNEYEEKKSKDKAEQDKKDILTKAEISKQKVVRNFSIAGAVGILSFGGFLFYNFRKRKKLENQQALANERLRISRDLHDDMGASLSSISVFSSAVKQKLVNNETREAEQLLDRMSTDAQEMVSGMSEMVWTISPHNDTIEKLTDRLQVYAAAMLSAKNISFTLECDEELKNKKLPVDMRKNIFLILKEAINNAAKYSDAAEVKLAVHKRGNRFVAVLADNGKGFDISAQRNKNGEAGNGLKNMRQRTDEIQSQIEINSEINKGTNIELTCNI